MHDIQPDWVPCIAGRSDTANPQLFTVIIVVVSWVWLRFSKHLTSSVDPSPAPLYGFQSMKYLSFYTINCRASNMDMQIVSEISKKSLDVSTDHVSKLKRNYTVDNSKN